MFKKKNYNKSLLGMKREAIEEIAEFCKTPEFVEAWVNAKGERFGDFLSKILKEKFLGETYGED